MSEIDETTKQHLPVGQVIKDLTKERDDLLREWRASREELVKAKARIVSQNLLLDDLQRQYNDLAARLAGLDGITPDVLRVMNEEANRLVAELASTAAALRLAREALREKEYDQDGDGAHWCSTCGKNPHAPGCSYAAALAGKEAGGGK